MKRRAHHQSDAYCPNREPNRNYYIADGTSASAPIFAGVVTLLNDARISKGLPPLGFMYVLILWAPDVSFHITPSLTTLFHTQQSSPLQGEEGAPSDFLWYTPN